MKKIIFTIIVLFTFIIKTYASSYTCNLSGDSTMYPYDETKSVYFYVVNMKIDIENIKDLSSFDMYIKYDKDLFGVYGCTFLNNNRSNCNFNKDDNSIITYNYKYSNKYNFDNTTFYTVSFISNHKTPNSGNSEVKVYFENVKDKNNNDSEINECIREIAFKEMDEYYIPSETKETHESTDSSSYIKNLTIKGYNIEFDSNTQEYVLKVSSDVNKLDIDVELFDSNGSYIISGASDLNSFGNKITITVTSSNNEERKYTINVLKDKQTIDDTNIKEKVKSFINFKNIKKNLPYILGGIIAIILLIILIKKLSSRKLDKYLDDI